jgi:hypothetical protein
LAKTTTADSPEKALAAKPGTTTLDRIRDKKIDIRTMTYDQLDQAFTADDQVLDAADLGDGFHLISGEGDKKKLVGVPFFVIDWTENDSTRFPGRTFFTLRIVTSTNDRVILNDGGAGIRQQLVQMKQDGIVGAIRCRHGLRMSEYEVTDENDQKVLDPVTKQPIRGRTFYLDTGV